jgi:hypothetical protein
MKNINSTYDNLSTLEERLAFIINRFLQKEFKVKSIDKGLIDDAGSRFFEWVEENKEQKNTHLALMGDEKNARKYVIGKLYIIYKGDPRTKIWNYKKEIGNYETPENIVQKLVKTEKFVKENVKLNRQQKKLWKLLIYGVPIKAIMKIMEVKSLSEFYQIKNYLLEKIRRAVIKHEFKINVEEEENE